MGKGKAAYHVKGSFKQDSVSVRTPFSSLKNFSGRTSEMKFLCQEQQDTPVTADPSITPDALCAQEIDKYVKHSLRSKDAWTSQAEIPTADEIADNENEKEDDNTITIPCNKLVDPWASREEYLEAHYRLLREDAVSPLRDVVSEMREEPQIDEKHSQESAAIYERVSFTTFHLRKP